MAALKFIKTSYKLPDNSLIISNLSEVFDEIKKFNGQAALIGGFVRSVILNEEINFKKISIDIATNLTPSQIIKIFGSSFFSHANENIIKQNITNLFIFKIKFNL